MKIKTFPGYQDAKNYLPENGVIKPKKILMTADINSDDNGQAWVLSDSQFKFLRENNTIF